LSFIEFLIYFWLRDARIPFLVYNKLTFSSTHEFIFCNYMNSAWALEHAALVNDDDDALEAERAAAVQLRHAEHALVRTEKRALHSPRRQQKRQLANLLAF
jgi:hypothetical protein